MAGPSFVTPAELAWEKSARVRVSRALIRSGAAGGVASDRPCISVLSRLQRCAERQCQFIIAVKVDTGAAHCSQAVRCQTIAPRQSPSPTTGRSPSA